MPSLQGTQNVERFLMMLRTPEAVAEICAGAPDLMAPEDKVSLKRLVEATTASSPTFDWIQIFESMLRDNRAVDQICAPGSVVLPVESKQALGKIYRKHCPPKPKDPQVNRKRKLDAITHQNSADESGESSSGRPAASGPWAPFLTLSKPLAEPKFLEEHFNAAIGPAKGKNRTEIGQYKVSSLLGDFYHRDSQVGAQLEKDFTTTEKEPGAAIMTVRYRYTLEIERRGTLDQVRQCFIWLMWYDLIQAVAPGTQGSRIGPKTRGDLQILLEAHVPETAIIQKIVDSIDLWSQCGNRIQKLCTRFGSEACIFFLYEHLTPTFVKYNMTSSGDYFDVAMSHLDSLDLKQKASDGDLIDLAQGARKALSLGFDKHVVSFMKAR